MPTIAQLTLAVDPHDAYANVLADSYTDAATPYAAFLTSSNGDMQPAWYFSLGETIPRYSTISGTVPFNVWLQAQPASNAVTLEFHLVKAGSPAMPTTVAGIASASRTSAKVELNASAAALSAPALLNLNLAPMLNEILQLSAVSAVVIVARDKVRSYVANNRVQFRGYSWDSASRPTLGPITHNPPPARTGSSSRTMAVSRSRTGSFPTSVAGAGSRTVGTSRFMAAQVGPPPAIVGKSGRVMEVSRRTRGGIGNPKLNTLFGFDRAEVNTHFAVTQQGEVYGFLTSFDTVLGGIRDGVIGNADDAWFPESGTRLRVPGPLPFTATLLEREFPKLDGDVLERELANVRELHGPDGRVLKVTDLLQRARPYPAVLELTARPESSTLTDPLLSGTLSAAFKTTDHTPEIPIFAIDAAGGIVAPLQAKRVDRGSLGFAVKLEDRGVLPLASIGRPIEGDGTSDPTSVTVSYQDRHLHVSIRGVLTRIREVALGPFGEVLAGRLFFTANRAHLVTASSFGLRYESLEVGEPVDLSERILTAGVDANGVGLGAFFSPPTSSLGIGFFSFMVPGRARAEREVQDHYRQLTRPGMTWGIVPPDYALDITRADTKAFELAPGESQTFDFAVKRVGSYSGGIDFAVVATGVSASFTVLGTSGDTTTYRVTVSAPTGTAEGSYPVHLDVKAVGADNPGSALAGVRDAFDALLEVAASPVVAPNPTYVLLVSDPVQKRPSAILADSSGQNNAFSFRGYARPGREGRSFLAVGKEGAAVESSALINTAQAHRMSGEQSHAMILREIERAAIGRVLFHAGADASADGPQIIRVQGGIGLRTVNGGAVADSPDALPIPTGLPAIGLRVTASEVLLTTRGDMRSIRLSRPAWSDAAVRAIWGAARSGSGAFSNLGRVHVVNGCGHPYALSDIQLRRTLDWLQQNVAPFDNKPEYPDGLYVLSQFNDNTTEQPQEKRRNYAAPALSPSWKPLGTGVTYPAGAVQTSGADDTVWTTDFVDFSMGSDFEAVAVINNLSQADKYLYAFAMASAGQYNGYFGVLKNFNGLPMLRVLTNDAEILQEDLANSSKTGKLVMRFTVINSGRKIRMTDLATNKYVQIDRGAILSGQTAFSVGAGYVAGPNGASNPRIRWPGKTTGLEVLVHKGLFTAQEVSDLKTLLL